MKKSLIVLLILLPALAMAQRGDNKSVKEFFNKYSAVDGYTSVEVTEDMFQMFDEMEDAESEMVTFMKKLKYVRFMEYKSSSYSSIGWVEGGKGSTTNTYWVDGKEVKAAGIAKGEKIKGKKGKVVEGRRATGTAVVVEGKPVTATAVPSASSGSNYSYSVSKSVVHNRALKEIDLKGYKTLMKSNQNGEKLLFLRRQFTSTPNDQEFLLISGNTLINIRGDINIKHIYELEEILEAVGEILPQ